MRGLPLSSWCRDLHGYVMSVKGKSIASKMRIKSAGYTMKERTPSLLFQIQGIFFFYSFKSCPQWFKTVGVKMSLWCFCAFWVTASILVLTELKVFCCSIKWQQFPYRREKSEGKQCLSGLFYGGFCCSWWQRSLCAEQSCEPGSFEFLSGLFLFPNGIVLNMSDFGIWR